MELYLQPFILPFFVAFLILFYAIMKRIREQPDARLFPPGPRKLPIIGNLHQIVGSNPHRSVTNLANKYGPIMHLQLGEISTIIISSPEFAKEVMCTKDISFANRGEHAAASIASYNYTDIGFAPYGEYWRQLKKICRLELLSAKRVNSFKSIRENEVRDLVKSISDSSSRDHPINLSKKIFLLPNVIIAKAAFGNKNKDQHKFISLVKEGFELGGGFSVMDIFPSYKFLHWISGEKPRLLKLHKGTDKIAGDIIDEHRVRRRARATNYHLSSEEDLVDVLLNIQENENLGFSFTDDNIKAVILDMFGAGSDTISTTVDWAMSELVKNPKLMVKVQVEVRHILKGKTDIDESDIQNMTYLKRVIKETLRTHPPGPFLLPREARETSEIGGYEIPFKTKVMINYWAISRDPRYWVDAECFDPDRFEDSTIDFIGANFEYIPFGAGRRMCPGISYAIAVVELLLAQLLYHFDWRLPNGMRPEELDMEESFGITVGRKNDLHLIAIPYIA